MADASVTDIPRPARARAERLIEALDADAAPHVLSGLAKVLIYVTANGADERAEKVRLLKIEQTAEERRQRLG